MFAHMVEIKDILHNTYLELYLGFAKETPATLCLLDKAHIVFRDFICYQINEKRFLPSAFPRASVKGSVVINDASKGHVAWKEIEALASATYYVVIRYGGGGV
jgi:hypothetical protein